MRLYADGWVTASNSNRTLIEAPERGLLRTSHKSTSVFASAQAINPIGSEVHCVGRSRAPAKQRSWRPRRGTWRQPFGKDSSPSGSYPFLFDFRRQLAGSELPLNT